MAIFSKFSSLCVLFLVLFAQAGHTGELRLVTWNLEHLNDTDDAGCISRQQPDYDSIARQVEDLGADIVAFQEVENVQAARRVFSEGEWHVEVSTRPSTGLGRPCWDRPEARLGRLATGFAIRKSLAYRRLPDQAALAAGNPRLRWGVEISVSEGNNELRLLSVHLKSGCWGAKEDESGKRTAVCAVLRRQMESLGSWAEARRNESTAFAILGDFNRRLALPGDWAWRTLSVPSASMHLTTEPGASRCDPRFKEFIDHIITGGGAEGMVVPNSFREAPRRGSHPDHCAIVVDISM